MDDLDINGWDIDKTLRLMRKSNPNILEWTISPIVYKETTEFASLRNLLPLAFNAKALCQHYISMAKNNCRDYLDRSKVNIKKYLYTIRPLMCALWVMKFNSQPPMLYNQLVDKIVAEKSVSDEIYALVSQKENINEADLIDKNEILHDWIHDQFLNLGEIAKDNENLPDWSPFNQCFYEIIGHNLSAG